MLRNGFIGQLLQDIPGLRQRPLPVLLGLDFCSDGLRQGVLFHIGQLGGLAKRLLQCLGHVCPPYDFA
jgi:hypothetical protein